MTIGPICIKNEFKRKDTGEITGDYSLQKLEKRLWKNSTGSFYIKRKRHCPDRYFHKEDPP
ncbi:MAG: hypothetical protein ACLTDF_02255 [Coprococcus sp.]